MLRNPATSAIMSGLLVAILVLGGLAATRGLHNASDIFFVLAVGLVSGFADYIRGRRARRSRSAVARPGNGGMPDSPETPR